MKNIFKWKQYHSEIIILCVRWYLKYPLSYRNLQEMMQERGLNINYTTIYRWVLEYSPELNRGLRKHLKQTGDSWRVDETYIKLNGKWMYLYRAVSSFGSNPKNPQKKALESAFLHVSNSQFLRFQAYDMIIG